MTGARLCVTRFFLYEKSLLLCVLSDNYTIAQSEDFFYEAAKNFQKFRNAAPLHSFILLYSVAREMPSACAACLFPSTPPP